MSELVEKLFAVHDALKAEALPHAFGGAIALAYCVEEPRGTRDLDVNIFCNAADAARVLAALPAGVRVGSGDVERVERDGQARLFWDGVPIDVFLNNLPLHEEVSSAIVWVPLEGREAPMLDCASLVLFKSFFDRTKDWGDIEAVAMATPEDVETAVGKLAELSARTIPPTGGWRRFATPTPPDAQAAGSSETAWLATKVPAGSQARLTWARREQVSAGRIESASQGESTKLK